MENIILMIWKKDFEYKKTKAKTMEKKLKACESCQKRQLCFLMATSCLFWWHVTNIKSATQVRLMHPLINNLHTHIHTKHHHVMQQSCQGILSNIFNSYNICLFTKTIQKSKYLIHCKVFIYRVWKQSCISVYINYSYPKLRMYGKNHIDTYYSVRQLKK